ncbi:MAG: hypothetical protein CMJ83_20665 [Planctomycetes bacterium]|jgi:hypothetical protein|nr:hypothetical protein [Planctomycetota bacterium]
MKTTRQGTSAPTPPADSPPGKEEGIWLLAGMEARAVAESLPMPEIIRRLRLAGVDLQELLRLVGMNDDFAIEAATSPKDEDTDSEGR